MRSESLDLPKWETDVLLFVHPILSLHCISGTVLCILGTLGGLIKIKQILLYLSLKLNSLMASDFSLRFLDKYIRLFNVL